MQQSLIWIDRLKAGQTQKIKESLDPSLMQIDEAELKFDFPVEVEGEAYLSEKELICRFKAATCAMMPCAICNQLIKIDLVLGAFYHAEPIDEIPGAVFDYREALREAFLIELPRYVECNGGKCPERSAIASYMHSKPKKKEEEIYFPFSGLDS